MLFALATFCGGATVIRNAGRLRLKESDRIEAMAQELAKMGARVQVDGDTVTIPQTAPERATASTKMSLLMMSSFFWSSP